jgi:hypothetical protein
VVEVLSAEEFECLQTALATPHPTDFNVRFALDGEHVSWSAEVCGQCDPFNYKHLLKKSKNNGRPLE